MVMGTHYKSFTNMQNYFLMLKEGILKQGGTPLELWWNSVFHNGQMAVDCFFVIAGFLAELPGRPHPVGFQDRAKFIAGKFLRLAPVYYAGAFFVFLEAFVVSASSTAEDFCTSGFMAIHWLSLPMQLTMTQSFFNFHIVSYDYFGVHDCSEYEKDFGVYISVDGNGALWFVSALFWGGYVVYALLGGPLMGATAMGPKACLIGAIFFGSLRGLEKAVSLGQIPALSSLFKCDPTCTLDVFPLTCTPAFFAGAYTSRLLSYLPEDGAVLTSRVWYLVDSAVILLWALLFPTLIPEWFLYDGPSTVNVYNVAPPTMCVLLVAMNAQCKGIILRFFEFEGLVAFGPLSFAAYALHVGVLYLMMAANWQHSSGISFLFFFTLTWMLAGMTSRYIEQPCLRAVSRWKWLKSGEAKPEAAKDKEQALADGK